MSAITATRPVRICLVMEDGPIMKAIKQVLPAGESHVYVAIQEEADFILFTNVRDIEQGYRKEKSYAYLKTSGRTDFQLPENCKTIGVMNMLVEMIEAIKNASEKLQPIAETPAAPTTEVPLLADAKRILVIDDTPKHLASAKTSLTGHKLTTASGYEQAMEILSKKKFDIVLTDLQLPMSSKTMGSKFKLGELVHYGVLLMIEAAHQGAKHVAVVTDLSHHDDPFSAAFDHFSSFPITIEGAKVRMLHARLNTDGTKDWNDALNRLLS